MLAAALVSTAESALSGPHARAADSPWSGYPAEKVELLLHRAADDSDGSAREQAEGILNGLAGGSGRNATGGGIFACAVSGRGKAASCTESLEVDSGLLENLVLARRVAGGEAYRQRAAGLFAFLQANLWDETTGSFRAELEAPRAYFEKGVAAVKPVALGDPSIRAAARAVSAFLAWHGTGGGEPARAHASKALASLLARAGSERSGREDPWLAGAALDAYEATGEPAYLEAATGLPAVPSDARGRRVEACERARTAIVLARLYYLTLEEKHLAGARSLAAGLDPAGEDERQAACAALALDWLSRAPLKIVVVGPASDPATAALREGVLGIAYLHRTIRTLNPERDRLEIGKTQFPKLGKPALYACMGEMCSAPVSAPADVAAKTSKFLEAAKKSAAGP